MGNHGNYQRAIISSLGKESYRVLYAEKKEKDSFLNKIYLNFEQYADPNIIGTSVKILDYIKGGCDLKKPTGLGYSSSIKESDFLKLYNFFIEENKFLISEDLFVSKLITIIGDMSGNIEHKYFYDKELGECKDLVSNLIVSSIGINKRISALEEINKNDNKNLRCICPMPIEYCEMSKEDQKNFYNEIKSIEELSVSINYVYFRLAKILWDIRVKNEEMNLSKVRKIDEASVQLLNAPRVQSKQIVSADGQKYWHLQMFITMELSEQSDEIIHHVNFNIENNSNGLKYKGE